MALTKTPIELSSTPSIVDGGNATAITIDSSENIGIGQATPKTTLNAAANNSGQGAILTLENTDTSITTNDVIGQIDFYANDSSTNGTGAKVNIKAIAASTAGTATALTFGTSSSGSATAVEAMRIDASGNFIVGGTQSNPTGANVAGASIDASGEGNFSVDGAEALRVNRLTSDGAIVQFMKAGQFVGSIAVASGNNLTIDGSVASHAGLEFGTGRITPRVAGATADNAVDLGYSTQRFQDLYLSGGAYLGGTADANKLDDYEEGTWTPVIIGDGGPTSGQSYGSVTAHYTKIGSFVFCACDIQLTAVGTINGNYAIINNLPFSVTTNHMGGGSVGYYSGINNNSGIVTFYVTQNQAYLMTGASGYVSKNDITNTTRIIATIVYKTAA